MTLIIIKLGYFTLEYLKKNMYMFVSYPTCVKQWGYPQKEYWIYLPTQCPVNLININ